MKKSLFALLCILFLQLTSAQVSFAGNPEYGLLKNFVYDKTIQNKIYATTYVDKHIMVSSDNGVSWNVFYTLPYPEYSPSIQEMRLTNNGTALSFIQYFGLGSPLNKIIVLDLQSMSIIKQFSFPTNESIERIRSYVIFDDGTMAKVIMLTGGNYDKLFYTSNGGTNWSKIYDSQNFEDVQLADIAMDPQNAQTIYIARGGGPGTVDGGLLKSTNAGATWTESLNGLILQSVTIDPNETGTLYVGTGVLWTFPTQHQAVYKTTNGGISWTEQTGISWSTGTTGLRNVPKISINPYDSNHVIALGDDRIAVTTNAGNTWTTTFHNGLVDGTSYFYAMDVGFNPNNLNQVLIANNRYPKKSTDRGITLTSMANPFFIGMGKINVVKDNNIDKLIYGVQYGYTVKNLVTNQETPISVMPLSEFPMGGQIGLMYVDRRKAGRSYVYEPSFMGNAIKVSDDYGTTQTPVYTTFDTGFTAAETNPNNTNIAWLATFNGANASLIRSNFTDPNNIVNDPITLPYDGDYIYGIKVNQNNSNEVLVTVGNRLFKTVNNGTSWIEITAGLQGLTLPNIALSLVQNPLNINQYTMTASNGIYTSVDSGNTWTKIYTGMVHKAEHSTTQDGQIIGITNSYLNTPAQVIYTNNNGTTWQSKSASTYFNTIVLDGTARFVSPTTAEVYLTTNSLGIIKDIIDFSVLGSTDSAVTKDDISIYPNPASDVINIKFGKNTPKFIAAIYSAAGQLILTVNNQNSINISGLTKGVYILKVDQEKEATIVKKIIKR